MRRESGSPLATGQSWAVVYPQQADIGQRRLSDGKRHQREYLPRHLTEQGIRHVDQTSWGCKMVGLAGFEPATPTLKVSCSTS